MARGQRRSRSQQGHYPEISETTGAEAEGEAEEEDDEATQDIEEEEEEEVEEYTGIDEEETEVAGEVLEGEGLGKEEIEGQGGRAKRTRSRKRARGRPPSQPERISGAPLRFRNAYMIYLAEYRALHAEEVSKMRILDVAHLVGERWKTLTEEDDVELARVSWRINRLRHPADNRFLRSRHPGPESPR